MEVLDDVFGNPKKGRIKPQLRDGTLSPGAGDSDVTQEFTHPGTLRAMGLPGDEAGTGEAYLLNHNNLWVRRRLFSIPGEEGKSGQPLADDERHSE